MVIFNITKKHCYYFNEICKIPHGTGNEKPLSDWLVNFAKEHKLEYVQDKIGNVVIYKQAFHGFEAHDGVIIGAHMDMVCQKTKESRHDFARDGLELYTDGDYLRARGTTLGADDGMGCAYMLGILDDDSLKHPFLECCFTVSEEAGMVGAMALKPQWFKARRLINLDGAGEIKTYMSMAGGAQAAVSLPLQRKPNRTVTYLIKVEGLLGGGAAANIDKQRANAIKIAARALMRLSAERITFGLADFCGGDKAGTIPDWASAVITTDENVDKLREQIAKYQKALTEEYELSDPNIRITLAIEKTAQTTLPLEQSAAVAELIYLLPSALQSRNLTLDSFPPITSCNLGVAELKNNSLEVGLSVRSPIDSAADDLLCHIRVLTQRFGGTVDVSGRYPGWKYEAKSPLRETLKEVYAGLYNKELLCLVGHGGNECGVFKRMFPDMDIVTSGAIYGNIHTTDEFLDLPSFDRAYVLLKELLEKL